MAFFTDLTRKIGVFRCKFYFPKILPVLKNDKLDVCSSSVLTCSGDYRGLHHGIKVGQRKNCCREIQREHIYSAQNLRIASIAQHDCRPIRPSTRVCCKPPCRQCLGGQRRTNAYLALFALFIMLHSFRVKTEACMPIHIVREG